MHTFSRSLSLNSVHLPIGNYKSHDFLLLYFYVPIFIQQFWSSSFHASIGLLHPHHLPICVYLWGAYASANITWCAFASVASQGSLCFGNSWSPKWKWQRVRFYFSTQLCLLFCFCLVRSPILKMSDQRTVRTNDEWMNIARDDDNDDDDVISSLRS